MTSITEEGIRTWSGRNVLVTGGQRGLGLAFTRELLARGAERVYVTARRPSAVDDARIVPLSLEVTDQSSVDRLAEAADDVSVVFNNAGVTGSPALDVLGSTLENAELVFATNVFGPVRIAQAFAPVLARHPHSALVTTNSVVSWLSGVGMYGASKAALWSITNSLRVELAAQHTLVTGVHLNFADTDMSARVENVDKLAPRDVADRVLDGVERGETEILVDDVTRRAKAGLAGQVESLALALAVPAH